MLWLDIKVWVAESCWQPGTVWNYNIMNQFWYSKRKASYNLGDYRVHCQD
jgi:hypothetical protein